MRQLTVSFGTVSPAAITTVKQVTWDSFASWLTREPPEAQDKAQAGWYIPGTFEPVYRDSDNFVSRDAITLDFDHVTIDAWGDVLFALDNIAFAIYTTFTHTDLAPRFRVVIPLSRPAGYDEFQAVARKIAEKIGIELVARESFIPSQMTYAPTRKFGAPFIGEVRAGVWLDVDATLREYNDWTDVKQWPHRREADGVHKKAESQIRPDEKDGVVGDFCRAFRVGDAILRFELPYVPAGTLGRWTYTNGTRPEGAIEYDDGLKFHSHHDTDPARGQHNAYDLVRLHKFGHLDGSGSEALAITDRPSYRAMADFVGQMPEVAGTAAADQYTDLGPLPTVTEEVVTDANGNTVERFLVRTADEFSSGPPVDWIVRGVLPRAELAVVYGESGSGKSFLALDLCGAITRGIEWRDKRVTRGRVVYVCAEGAGGFKARLRAYARGHEVELHELPAVIADAPNMLEPKDAALITRSIENWGKVDVVIIDTLSATTPGGNENSGEDMGRVLSHCKLLHRKTGALVVLIHHSGKDATKGARGWSGLRAAADAEIEVTRNGDFRAATVTKMKDGSDGASWSFKLKTLVLGLDQYGEEESSCIVEHVEQSEAPASTKQRPSGKNQIPLYEVLKVMAPSGTVNYDDLVDGYVKKMPKSGEGRDRRRRDAQRALEELIAKKLAYMHGDDRVSLTTNIKLDEGDWLS
jgi:AAA domain-containing protein